MQRLANSTFCSLFQRAMLKKASHCCVRPMTFGGTHRAILRRGTVIRPIALFDRFKTDRMYLVLDHVDPPIDDLDPDKIYEVERRDTVAIACAVDEEGNYRLTYTSLVDSRFFEEGN